MTDHTCSRCSIDLDDPIKETSNYIQAVDFVEEKERMKLTAVTPPESSILDGVADYDVANVVQEAFNGGKEYFSVIESGDVSKPVLGVPSELTEESDSVFHVDDFSYQIIDSQEEVDEIPGAEFEVMKKVKFGVQKTALICPDCLKDSDEIIWGVDSK